MTRLESPAALSKEAQNLAATLSPKEEGAMLVTLSGELGAGKTTFAAAFAAALGVTEAVTSPTFVLAKAYPLENQTFSTLLHIDAYRMKGSEELPGIGFTEAVQDSKTLILLEWPEMVADGLPKADVAIRIEHEAADARTITYA